MKKDYKKSLGIIVLLAIVFSTFLGAKMLYAQYYGAPVVQTRSATDAIGMQATLNGTVNPNNYETTYWFEYGTDNALNNRTGGKTISSTSYDVSVNTFLSGLYQNTTYSFRLVAQNTQGTQYGSVLTFVTGSTSGSTVITYSATDVGSNNATLWGYSRVTGSGAGGWFEYGMSAYSFPYSTSQSSLYNWQSQRFSQSITNLSSGTTYYFRAVVRDGSSVSYGQTLSFTTQGYGGYVTPYYTQQYAYSPTYVDTSFYSYNAPSDSTYLGDDGNVWTLPMQFVSDTSVTLRGSVDPSGYQTTVWFEYGQSRAPSWSSERRVLGAYSGSSVFSIDVQGLSPGVTYYYRAVSQNAQGTFHGALRGFRIDGGYVAPVSYSYQPVAQQPVWYGTTGYMPYNAYASMYPIYSASNVWYNTPGSALSASVVDTVSKAGITAWQLVAIVAVLFVLLGFVLVAAVR